MISETINNGQIPHDETGEQVENAPCVRLLKIQNFRGIHQGEVYFAGHTLLVGGNNAGKSTVCEALDLVLGPERLYRKPVVNEHDFYCGRYIDDSGNPIEIRIEAILTDLSEEAERRFSGHLRRWNKNTGRYADENNETPAHANNEGTCWALPVIFIGRYDASEDDFIGDTFFSHPIEEIEDDDEDIANELGAGLKQFNRNHKRLCGFLFLRTLRTGSRALSLQRGSLLDTILKLSETGYRQMWCDTLTKLHDLNPAIGEIEQLKKIRSEIKIRMSRFVNLASCEEATAFFASNLTRENLREVIRFFVTSEQSGYLVPFQNLGTGLINILVFVLLTFIADLKSIRSVIFAMEEPEIALPPHTQRKVVRFVLSEMGQAIVTSHSPYVIEQFEPGQIVIIERKSDGGLVGKPIDTQQIKPKKFKMEHRQFAEAILSRGVLVVEGHTEVFVFSSISTVLEKFSRMGEYIHIDLAGVSIFNAEGQGSVPQYGPIFKALGKLAFGFYDKLDSPLSDDARAKLGHYTNFWESPYKGTEKLLIEEVSVNILRRFLALMNERLDYPSGAKRYHTSMSDNEVKDLAFEVMKARKAEGYGGMLIEQCQSKDELPMTVRSILENIHMKLNPSLIS